MTRAAIYARISRDREGEALGVQRQTEDCRRLVAEHDGWIVAGEYIDNDITAADPRRQRPEYNRLLADIEAGRIDAVVVWAEDRLHRQPIELEQFVAVCDRANVTELVTVTGTVNMGTGDGMLVARIKGAVAAEEVRKLKERIRRKKRELAERGLPSGGGGRPFGYDFDHVTIIPHEAAMIRDAAEKVLQGATLVSIRNEWRESGVLPVGGGTWATKSVRNTLTRPRYAGLRQHQGTVIGDAQWPAILERDTWERAVALLTNPARRNAPTTGRYPFSGGIFICGSCGHPMSSMPRGNTRMYGCRKALGGGRCGKVQVTAEPVEAYLLRIILRMADSDEMIGLASAHDEMTAIQVRDIIADNSEDQRMLTQLDDDYADQAIPRATYMRQSARLRQRIEERDNRLSTMRSTSVLNGHVEEQWDTMTADQQSQVIRAIVSTVVVSPTIQRGFPRFDPRRITAINWNYPSLARLTDNESDPAWQAEIAASQPITD